MFDPRAAASCTALLALTAFALGIHPIQHAHGQEKYPERPIRLVIPFAPGGQTDIMARRIAVKATPMLGQQVVPDNRAGAGGTVGSNEVARAKPDGYTVLLATSSTHAINPTAMEKIPYDAVRDFAPVAVLGTVPMAIVIHPSIPAKNLRELVALAKARPGQFSYGSTGVGGINHLGGELLKLQAGRLDIIHVPYKSSGLALQDLMGGHIPITISTLSSAMHQHREGRVRILAVASDTRSQAAPDIPTAIEAGVPGMVAYTFNAVLLPAHTPPAIVERWHKTAAAIMADDAFVKDLVTLGIEPIRHSDPQHAADFIKREIARWAPVIKEAMPSGK
jgi:tripartite-type tricarboxylate transporter receptor subunit TctC